MLAIAASATPAAKAIDWREADAQQIPFADNAFDVVLCQMGLQFFADQRAAAAEMRRVLAPEGRLLATVPGPTPEPFGALAAGLAHHIDEHAAQFVHQVFSLHDPQHLHDLFRAAGFTQIELVREPKTLRLRSPAAFLWQYVRSTPLAGPVGNASPESRNNLEHEVLSAWNKNTDSDGMTLQLQMLTACASG